MALGSIIGAAIKKKKQPANTNYKELLGGMSDYDKMYSNDLGGILKAKNNYMNAATDEDRAYWNNYANNIRKEDGYYGGATGAELNPILNMPDYKPFSYKDFAYNPDKDKSYQIYADKYKREGQSASERALADTSAATGGMPSSYAAAANAQTQQAYAKKTADMIPLLEQQAFDRFNTNREFDYRDYLNDFNYQREDTQLRNQDMWRNKEYGDSRDDLAYNREFAREQFDYEKFINDRTREDNLSQLDIDNKYRQSRFDWDVGTDSRDYNRNVFTQDRAYNYNAEQDRLSREDKEKQFNYERYQKDLEANYPNTVMGQLEARTKEAQEADRQNNIRAAISSAMQAPNAAEWLRENAAYLSDEEYASVIKILKDYGTISKQGE